MTEFAGDIAPYELGAARRNQILLCMAITIGAAGAVGSVEKDDPALGATKDAGTGEYDLTFPKSLGCAYWFQLESPLGTVTDVEVTVAASASAGTVTIVTQNSGSTATNPASGDRILCFFLLRQRSET